MMLKMKKGNSKMIKSFHWRKTKAQAFQIIIRIALGIIITISAILTLYIGRKPYGEELKEGDVSLRTIYAPIAFIILIS